MKKNEENFYKKFRSPIPPHLSPEEREEWEKEEKWQQEEHERLRREGKYRNQSKGSLFKRIVESITAK